VVPVDEKLEVQELTGTTTTVVLLQKTYQLNLSFPNRLVTMDGNPLNVVILIVTLIQIFSVVLLLDYATPVALLASV